MEIHILLYTVCHLSSTDEVYVVQSTVATGAVAVENHVMNLTVFVLVLMPEELWNSAIIESATFTHYTPQHFTTLCNILTLCPLPLCG